MSRKQLAIIVLVVALLVALLAAGKSLLRNELSPVGVGAEAPDFAVMPLDSVAKR